MDAHKIIGTTQRINLYLIIYEQTLIFGFFETFWMPTNILKIFLK